MIDGGKTYAGEWDSNPRPEIFAHWLRRSGSEVITTTLYPRHVRSEPKPTHIIPPNYHWARCKIHSGYERSLFVNIETAQSPYMIIFIGMSELTTQGNALDHKVILSLLEIITI